MGKRTRKSSKGTKRLPKVCIDKYLPADQVIAAGERAMAERHSNAPLLAPARGASAPPRLRMALEAAKKWDNGRTLRVAFLEGDPTVQQKVEFYARKWEQYANVHLDFGPYSNAEVRIAFDQVDGGSWSYIGTDALGIAKRKHTMNFGWLTPHTDDQEYERVVVHEFGHALGCIHEHQNPNANIPWDKEKVYAFYARQKWSRADVDTNIFRTYSRTQVNATEFDPQSIMLYAVPNEHTIGDFEIGWNTSMSARDKEFISQQYPKAAPTVPTLVVDGPAAMNAISVAGESDRFEFTIARKGRYVVETTGKTDLVLALFGPDNPSTWIAEDDDSGSGHNSRLVVPLSPGKYVVIVRHYSHAGVGNYGVQVRTKS